MKNPITLAHIVKADWMRNRTVLVLVLFAVIALARVAGAEVDREKLLKEPGVYATLPFLRSVTNGRTWISKPRRALWRK